MLRSKFQLTQNSKRKFVRLKAAVVSVESSVHLVYTPKGKTASLARAHSLHDRRRRRENSSIDVRAKYRRLVKRAADCLHSTSKSRVCETKSGASLFTYDATRLVDGGRHPKHISARNNYEKRRQRKYSPLMSEIENFAMQADAFDSPNHDVAHLKTHAQHAKLVFELE